MPGSKVPGTNVQYLITCSSKATSAYMNIPNLCVQQTNRITDQLPKYSDFRSWEIWSLAITNYLKPITSSEFVGSFGWQIYWRPPIGGLRPTPSPLFPREPVPWSPLGLGPRALQHPGPPGPGPSWFWTLGRPPVGPGHTPWVGFQAVGWWSGAPSSEFAS